MKHNEYNKNGLNIARVGLGCMRMSMSPKSLFKRDQSIATIRSALDSWVKFLNTGTFYGFFNHNLKLVWEAVKGYKREDFFISLKYGNFTPMAMLWANVKIDWKYAREYLLNSLKHLELEYVDLYQPARVDAIVPIEETMKVMKELVDEGLIKYIGLSEVDSDTLRRAHAIHPISLLEVNYSVINNSVEKELLATARELGIGVVAFWLLGWFGKISKNEDDSLVKIIKEIAKEKNTSLIQIAHAWINTRGDDIIPLLGARTDSQLKNSIESLDITFSETETTRMLDAIKASKITGSGMPNMSIKNGKIKLW